MAAKEKTSPRLVFSTFQCLSQYTMAFVMVHSESLWMFLSGVEHYYIEGV